MDQFEMFIAITRNHCWEQVTYSYPRVLFYPAVAITICADVTAHWPELSIRTRMWNHVWFRFLHTYKNEVAFWNRKSPSSSWKTSNQHGAQPSCVILWFQIIKVLHRFVPCSVSINHFQLWTKQTHNLKIVNVRHELHANICQPFMSDLSIQLSNTESSLE